MKLLKLVIILGSAFSIHHAHAQTVAKGKVIDANGNGIAGVSVKSNHSTIQTETDGSFLLAIKHAGKFQLHFSTIGYQKLTIQQEPQGDTTQLNNISLKQVDSNIEEIEVIGYNSINKKSLEVSKGGIMDKDLPQAVQVINEQVIADQQVNRLSDALKNANGIALGANRGGVNENFYARGYSLGSNNILKNGSRTNNGGSIEASMLESVQIMKGSAALLYGGVTGGAVVNLITKKPKFENGAEVSMRLGSYNQYKPMVDVYGPLSNKLAFRLVGTGEYAESYRDYVESKRLYVSPAFLYRISDNTEINLMADYQKSNYTPDFGIGSVDGKINVEVGRNSFINVPWAYNKTDSYNTQLDVKHHFSDSWNLQVLGSFQKYDKDYFGAERIQANVEGITNRTLNKSKQDEKTFNQQLNLTGQVKTGFLSHQILIGADADQSNVLNYAYSIYANGAGEAASTAYDKINVFDPYNSSLRSDIPLDSLNTRTGTNIYRYGVFAQDLLKLTSKFKVLLGVRYTYQKTGRSEVYNYKTGETTINPNKGKEGVDMGDIIDKAWSPKFALIYQPIEHSSFYISYANNFTSNTGYDVNYKPMGPSLIDQYEAGIKNDFYNGRLTANLTWYKIINNRLAQTIIGADGKVADSNMKEFTGKTASDGVELDVTGQLTKGLNIIAGYAYNFMRYLETNDNGSVEGVRLVGTTAHTANGTVFYTFQSGRVNGLKLGFSTFYTGKRNAGWNNTKVNEREGLDRLIPVDGFTTFDFSAGYTIKKWSLLAKVSNIGNKFNYYVHENYSVNPIPPRSFSTTLSYKF